MSTNFIESMLRVDDKSHDITVESVIDHQIENTTSQNEPTVTFKLSTDASSFIETSTLSIYWREKLELANGGVYNLAATTAVDDTAEAISGKQSFVYANSYHQIKSIKIYSNGTDILPPVDNSTAGIIADNYMDKYYTNDYLDTTGLTEFVFNPRSENTAALGKAVYIGGNYVEREILLPVLFPFMKTNPVLPPSSSYMFEITFRDSSESICKTSDAALPVKIDREKVVLKNRKIKLSDKGRAAYLQGLSIIDDKIVHTYLHQRISNPVQIGSAKVTETSTCNVDNLATAIDTKVIDWGASRATGTYVTRRLKSHQVDIGIDTFPRNGYENKLATNDVFNSYVRYRRACMNSSATHKDVVLTIKDFKNANGKWLDCIDVLPDRIHRQFLTTTNNQVIDKIELENAPGNSNTYLYTCTFGDAVLLYDGKQSGNFKTIYTKTPLENNPKLDVKKTMRQNKAAMKARNANPNAETEIES